MNKIKVSTYSIDVIKADSPEHRALKMFQNVSFTNFPTIIAIRINQKNNDSLQLLALENLTHFQPSITNILEQKILILYEILRSIWFLHQKQYYTGKQSINHILFYDIISKKIKLKPYLAAPIAQFKPQLIKKDKNIAKNGIQLSLQFDQNPIYLDIWKWASFAAHMLFSFSLQNYIDKAFNTQKKQELIAQIIKKQQFAYDNDLIEMLKKCLSIKPTQRPPVKQIMLCLNKIISSFDLQINNKTIGILQKQWKHKQNNIKSQSSIEIVQNLLLTNDLKKKLNQQFLKNTSKSAKSYKPLYRATRFDFNTRVFYQQCSKRKKLLFVIDSQDSGIICCYIEPQIDLLQGDGLCGSFIADPECKSFIYSLKNQQSYKLIMKQKAYKSVPGCGPIIGDGDIIIGQSQPNNICNFPKSYQTGKHKKLTLKPQFRISNYDVYQIQY